jgi:hypothetical protein
LHCNGFDLAILLDYYIENALVSIGNLQIEEILQPIEKGKPFA